MSLHGCGGESSGSSARSACILGEIEGDEVLEKMRESIMGGDEEFEREVKRMFWKEMKYWLNGGN